MSEVVTFSGIKCDHCDYRNDKVEFKDYKDWIGKECPVCASPLLSQSEYDDCVSFKELMEISASICTPEMEELGKKMLEELNLSEEALNKLGEDIFESFKQYKNDGSKTEI